MVQPLVLREALGEGLIDRCPDREQTGFSVGQIGQASVSSGRHFPYRVRVVFYDPDRATLIYNFDWFREAQDFARNYYEESFHYHG